MYIVVYPMPRRARKLRNGITNEKEQIAQNFIFILIAAILLTMQGLPLMAETTETEQPENPTEVPAEQPESGTETEVLEQPESQTETLMEQSAAEANSLKPTGLSDDILAKCIVPGQNLPGVIVNLFDYWQDNPEKAGKEVPHDYYYDYWDYDNEKREYDGLAVTYVQNKLGADGFPILN